MVEAGVVRESSGVANSRCALHPDRQGVAVCDRCGDYHCADCHKRLAGRALCARCRELPGVDYLEETRRRFWGKRDGFVWYFGGFIPVVALLMVPNMIGKADGGHWLSFAAWLIFGFAYLAKHRLARAFSLPLTAFDLCADLLRAALGVAITPGSLPRSQAEALGQAIAGGVMGLVVALAAYRSPRNRLAFELDVDERGLERVYDRYVSNPTAVRGAVYGVIALFFPFASLITLFMSIGALRRVAPDAWPPRGGRLPAVLGIAVSALGVLGWGLLVFSTVLRLAR